MMTNSSHGLFYIRRNGHVIGPFAEALICQYIVLGRIGGEDEISQDGHLWHKPDELPELMQEVQRLIGHGQDSTLDPRWRDERIKASLRWLDERISLDRRSNESPEVAAAWATRRQGSDRRAQPETPEQHHYRQEHAVYETWLREQHQRYGKELFLLAILLLGVAVIAFNYQAVNPIKVGLFVPSTSCNLPAAPGIDWAGCDKKELLLVGSDLSGANLSRAILHDANLSYTRFNGASMEGADMTNADLQHASLRGAKLYGTTLLGANLEGADLTGAELDQVIWVDGRVCQTGSRGQCR